MELHFYPQKPLTIKPTFEFQFPPKNTYLISSYWPSLARHSLFVSVSYLTTTWAHLLALESFPSLWFPIISKLDQNSRLDVLIILWGSALISTSLFIRNVTLLGSYFQAS